MRKSARITICTKEHPMPEGANIPSINWLHEDVTEIEDMDTLGILFECNSCKLRFVPNSTRG